MIHGTISENVQCQNATSNQVAAIWKRPSKITFSIFSRFYEENENIVGTKMLLKSKKYNHIQISNKEKSFFLEGKRTSNIVIEHQMKFFVSWRALLPSKKAPLYKLYLSNIFANPDPGYSYSLFGERRKRKKIFRM